VTVAALAVGIEAAAGRTADYIPVVVVAGILPVSAFAAVAVVVYLLGSYYI
jgi:hypothetical protein